MNKLETAPKVAYFCMEYGLHEELPIYAGGLGVLAGDYIKAAKDVNAPMVAIGILWRQDYTHQYIGEDNRPYDQYPNQDYDFIKDTGVTVTVRVRGSDVTCKVRLVDQYGNIPLYLLDTNFPGSEHGWMTEKLYGGVAQDRIAQEIILGVGGVRALRALGIDVDVYHFNEGHAVFAGFELIREKMAQKHLSFEEALNATKKEVVFTTHTPVEAGNEVHEHSLLQYMEANIGLTYEQLQKIGGDPFNMTVAALTMSSIANAVSKCHGHTAREMWRHVGQKAPIISITNGVHRNTWQDSKIREAFEKGTDLWKPHMENKLKLVDYIEKHCNTKLDPNKIIVGFARRAAPYKRSDLIFRDTQTVDSLLKDQTLQLVFSGKAHPNDGIGKDIIKHLVDIDKKYGASVVFIENYNMEVARLMVRGCDVWLNNPKRPLEASGTSGMKAAMNGVLNLSVVDGWVAEGPQHGISGWLLDEYCKLPINEENQDEQDLKALNQILINEVIPTFYDHHDRWVDMMRASIDMCHWQFSSHRMLREYYDIMYQKSFDLSQSPELPSYMFANENLGQQQQNTY